MRVRIHRGAREIGGNCVELEAQGQRLVLDLGRPLCAEADEELPLPPIVGLEGGSDPSLLGVVISHPHQDHYGLLPQISPRVPLFLGEAATRLLAEAAFFSPAGARLIPSGFLRDREPLELGPFRVTPFLVDHSAFDAYSLLVEADGRRLFYTGDLRAHGRKARLFERLLSSPPAQVDALLMEGTLVHPQGHAPREEATEADVERLCREHFEQTAGMPLVVYSAQNLDRLVTLYRAALKANRDLVLDLYTATMARAASPSIPQPGRDWPRVKVFVPRSQALRVKQAQEFDRVDWVRPFRVYPEQLQSLRERVVMTFRASMAADLERAGCLEGASLVWSLWGGYLEGDARLQRFCDRHRLRVTHLHSSGHAFVRDLRRLADAFRPGRIVPIHSSAPGRFEELFSPVERHEDGEWWAV